MSTFNLSFLRVLALVFHIIAALFSVSAQSSEPEFGESLLGRQLKPQLGRSVSNYIGSIVSPDGSGLPQGIGSVEQGKQVFKVQCQHCHGMDGRMPGNQLAGGEGSLASAQPVKTVGSFWPYATTLYDYIARAMPYGQAKSLAVTDVYAVTAYVLYLNNILDDDATLDANTIIKVRMPNVSGFIELPN